jgi:hypothetical protein
MVGQIVAWTNLCKKDTNFASFAPKRKQRSLVGCCQTGDCLKSYLAPARGELNLVGAQILLRRD